MEKLAPYFFCIHLDSLLVNEIINVLQPQWIEAADDLDKLWYHPKTDAKIKKRIVRLLIKQVWVKLISDKTIKATIHWHGGVHTEYEFQRRHRRSTVKNSASPLPEHY